MTPNKLWGFIMEKMFFALSLGFGGMLWLTQTAEASQCAPREQVVAGLATGFDEVRRGAGLTRSNQGQAQVFELYTSAAGSWTILVTLPDGISCLVTSGEAWQDMADQLPAKGDPA